MSETVLLLQKKLKTLGFNPGALDGDFGDKTKAALEDFQAGYSLPVNGKGDLTTMKALDQAIEGEIGPAKGAEITAARLKQFAPRCDYDVLAPILAKECRAHHIVTPRRVRHFLAQISHESGGLRVFEENLNYRDPARLDAMFSKVRGEADAKALIAKGPRAIANRVYADRGGNGNEASGDGWRFRGQGPLQITFRDNYARASKWTGVDLLTKPELLLTPAIGIRAACGFWKANGLNEIADEDDGEVVTTSIAQQLRVNEEDDVRQATRVVNGPALAGLEDRKELLKFAATIWK